MECLQYIKNKSFFISEEGLSFKPCYKWNAFNTLNKLSYIIYFLYVLNLVINGMPSIHYTAGPFTDNYDVLNLVINGMPSILLYH